MSEDQTLNLSDFAKVIDFNSLYQSYTEARKGKRWKYAVCKYEVNVLENLMFVHFMLSAHKYRLSPYNCFIVKEPKERLIMYNSFEVIPSRMVICVATPATVHHLPFLPFRFAFCASFFSFSI